MLVITNYHKRSPITDSHICKHETMKPYDGTLFFEYVYFLNWFRISKSSIFEYMSRKWIWKMIMTTNTTSQRIVNSYSRIKIWLIRCWYVWVSSVNTVKSSMTRPKTYSKTTKTSSTAHAQNYTINLSNPTVLGSNIFFFFYTSNHFPKTQILLTWLHHSQRMFEFIFFHPIWVSLHIQSLICFINVINIEAYIWTPMPNKNYPN